MSATAKNRARFVLIACTICAADRALGNPCVVSHVAGRNVRAEGAQPEVRIASEKIVIDAGLAWTDRMLHFRSLRFTIDYVFENATARRELVIGFPIGGPYRSPKKHADTLPIAAFKVTGDGVGSRVELQAEEMQRWAGDTALHLCERAALPPSSALGKERLPTGYSAGEHHLSHVSRRDSTTLAWFFWNQTFRPGRTKLRVSYTLRSPDWCATHYILRTTRHWGAGTIGKLHIEVRQHGLKRPTLIRARLGTPPALRGVRRIRAIRLRPQRVDRASRTMIWELEDVPPSGDLTLSVPGCTTH